MVRVAPLTAAETRPLRQAVLRPHQDVDDVVLPGDDDPVAVHLGAFDGDRLVGVASLVPDDGARIRGVAVDPAARGLGAGRALVEALVREAGGPVWCTARTNVLGFWRRLGFVADGEPFDVPDLGEHVLLRRER